MWTREMAQQQRASKVICGDLNVISRTHVDRTSDSEACTWQCTSRRENSEPLTKIPCPMGHHH